MAVGYDVDLHQLEQELLVPQDPAAFKLWIKARRRQAKTLEAEMRQTGGGRCQVSLTALNITAGQPDSIMLNIGQKQFTTPLRRFA